MYMLVYPVHKVGTEDTVTGEGLVVMPLEAVNMARKNFHHPAEWTFGYEVVS